MMMKLMKLEMMEETDDDLFFFKGKDRFLRQSNEV